MMDLWMGEKNYLDNYFFLKSEEIKINNCRYVSHVGLRRIIIETSDITQQLGTDLTR